MLNKQKEILSRADTVQEWIKPLFLASSQLLRLGYSLTFMQKRKSSFCFQKLVKKILSHF